MSNQDEQQYLDLLRKVLEKGEDREDRTGTGTKSLFGERLEFNLKDNILPVLTTKKIPVSSVIKELQWFLSGQTNSKILEKQGVSIWKANTSRSFLDQRNLNYLEEGDAGANYSHQWRHFGAIYKDCNTDYGNQGVDQIAYIINLLKNDPYSRRIFLSAWNPLQLRETCLPPCHVSLQLYVDKDNRINGQMYQRSGDLFLGVPWNITSYSLLIHYLAYLTQRKPGKLIIVFGDVHIYNNHIEQTKTQLKRTPYSFPTISLSEVDKIENFNNDTVLVKDYQSHPKITASMAV